MFKNIIAPVQAWLLSQGKCVGCGAPLKKARVVKKKSEDEEVVACKCSRMFIYDQRSKKYRRALFKEIK